MIPQLSALEARLIGSLIEKQITTPDQYPLSLNALVLACNQKSNRDPILDLDEHAVQEVLDALMRKHMVLEKSGFGSRVPKFQQRFCNTEFSALQFTPQERAILCELLLRGPQTPGELRTRASRMAPIADVSEVEAALQALERHEKRPLIQRLAREPGRRDSRCAQLFTEPVAECPAPPAVGLAAPSTATVTATVVERLEHLEAEVRQLRQTVEALRGNTTSEH